MREDAQRWDENYYAQIEWGEMHDSGSRWDEMFYVGRMRCIAIGNAIRIPIAGFSHRT